MLVLKLPKTFKIGDTIDYPRNANEMVQVTWRDAETIVIEPDDIRTIMFAGVMEEEPEPVLTIIGTDEGVASDDYEIDKHKVGGFDVVGVRRKHE
jgi:hypothetical protein